jgi:hypothetical protein
MRTVGLVLGLAACSVDSSPRDAKLGDDTAGLLGVDSGEPDLWPRWEGDIEVLIGERCVACHSGDLAGGQLDLTSDIRPATVGQPSSQTDDYLLIEEGDHLYSYLWHKVNGSQGLAGGSGTNMPIGGWLSEAELARLGTWIDVGCP